MTQAVRVLLVRHGAFALIDRLLSGEAPGPGLNDEGRRQIGALEARLRADHVGQVVTSPLRRAVESARLLADAVGLSSSVDDDLRDVDYGEWTGRCADDLTGDPRWHRYNRHRSHMATPGGESAAQVQARAVDALRRLAAGPGDAAIVAVTHCDVIRAVACRCLGLSLDAITRLTVAAASITEVHMEAPGLRLVCVNDRAHLDVPRSPAAPDERCRHA
jgi:broad specificity phosphatase PhoE